MADLGQVFTSSVVADYMVSLFDLPKEARILDPCYGEGAFFDPLLLSGYECVDGCEIDSCLFKKSEKKYSQINLMNVDFLNLNNTKEYDGIIMNPPYIRQERIDDLKSYGITKKLLRNKPIYRDLPSSANMYMYFIIKAISMLRERGELVVIFPSSWTNAKTGKIFKKLMFERCGLKKYIHIFGNVFEKNALVDVVILKLVKGVFNISAEEEYLEVRDGCIYTMASTTNMEFKLFEHLLSEFATVKRGITTGYNNMYINPDIQNAKKSSTKMILSSPKNVEGYSTKEAQLDELLFPTGEALSDELFQYLDFWKNKIIKEKKPKVLYQKILKDMQWYKLREIDGYGIIFSYFVRNNMKFIMNENGVLVRDNFYIITPKAEPLVLFSLLNNFYTYYQLELNGKKYGAGLLKLQRYDLERLCFPALEEITNEDKKQLTVLSRELIDNGNDKTIYEITKIVSKYSKVSYETIIDNYFSVKKNRLGGV